MRRWLLAAALILHSLTGAGAEPVRIGLVLTMSGPSAALGQHVRDGFHLGLKLGGGRLGPSEAEIELVDDERSAARAGQAAEAMAKAKSPAFIVGPLFSELIAPVLKAATPAGTIVLSPHAGPALLAGKRCQPNFFSLAPQDDQAIEVLTKFAEERNLRRAIIVSTAGEEAEIAATAFRRTFKGEVADRLLIDVAASDFSDALNRIDILKPQALFLHVSGAAGARFIAELHRSGAGSGPVLLGSFGFDQADVAFQGDAVIGAYSGGDWAQGVPGAASAAFVAAFEAEYGYAPGAAAMRGFDAARLISKALEATSGKTTDRTALADAIRQADIESSRGKFIFGNNNFPIQDLYLTRVEKHTDGKNRVTAVRQVFAQYGDHYAAECPQK
ncbi:MAG TPA: penicillin-binding protein activator [Beijerinckiaceae bacterium]|nr:penicillin-binding protein activator [Beijerinckiaceae bacterium]